MQKRRQQLIEIGSWRLAAEILRHYPKDIRIIETHPGQGQYDCLTLVGGKIDHPLFINRCGSISGEGPGFNTAEVLLDGDIAETQKTIFAAYRIEYKQKLPATTPQALVYRLIAEILSQAAFAKEYWECRNGYDDSSGWGCWADREKYFRKFPGAKKRAAVHLKDDLYNVPDYRFWFIMKDGNPICCFETTGVMWNMQGKQFDLMQMYKKHRRLWPIISATLGDKLN